MRPPAPRRAAGPAMVTKVLAAEEKFAALEQAIKPLKA